MKEMVFVENLIKFVIIAEKMVMTHIFVTKKHTL